MAHPFAKDRYREVTIHGLNFRVRRVSSADLLQSGSLGGNILLAVLPRSGEDFAEFQAVEETADPELKQKRALQLVQRRIAESQKPEHQKARLERAVRLVAAGLVAIETSTGWVACQFVEGPAPAELPDVSPAPIYAELLPRGPLTVLELGEAILRFSGGADPSRIERFRHRPPSPPVGGSDCQGAGKMGVGSAGTDTGAAGAGDCEPPSARNVSG